MKECKVMFTEYKIGETFKHGEVVLKTVEAPIEGCLECYFYQRRCDEVLTNCSAVFRDDRKSVIFIEQKTEER